MLLRRHPSCRTAQGRLLSQLPILLFEQDPRELQKPDFYIWVALEIRVPFIRVPYYIGDLKWDLNLENFPGSYFGGFGCGRHRASGCRSYLC